jgi:hypothetical protein
VFQDKTNSKKVKTNEKLRRSQGRQRNNATEDPYSGIGGLEGGGGGGIHVLPRPVGEQRQRQEPRVGAVLAVQVAEVEHDRLVADLVVAEAGSEEGRVVEGGVLGGELPRGFAAGAELSPGRRQRGEHLVEEVVLPAVAVHFAAGRLHVWDSRQRLAGHGRGKGQRMRGVGGSRRRRRGKVLVGFGFFFLLNWDSQPHP